MDIVLNILMLIIGVLAGAEKEIKEKYEVEFEDHKKKITVDLKEEFADWKNEYNRKQSQKANRLNEMERRLIQREENLDRRYINLDNKEKEIKKKEKDVSLQEEELAALKEKLTATYEEEKLRLQKISGMTTQEARELIIKQCESEARLEAAQRLKTIEDELREKSIVSGKNIISTAIQRLHIG